jgi:uncharacterized protein YoxC
MKGQKQSRIDLLANKIEVLARVVQGLSQQMEHITNLSIGTHELTKQMPDYAEALEKLKQDSKIEEKTDSDVE